MYRTGIRFHAYLSPLPSLPLSTASIVPLVSSAFFLVTVTGVEVAKLNASFLTLFIDFVDTC